MIIQTKKHLQAVLADWRKAWKANPQESYLVMDSETEGKDGMGKKAALVIGRSETLCWSLCYKRAAYTLPTQLMGIQFPPIGYWDDILKELAYDSSLLKVCHNMNYDGGNVLPFNHGVTGRIFPFWCTSIGAWMAAPYMDKSLKDRAILFGRQQQKTKTVDFGNPQELANYAEFDVICTEELFWLQTRGGKFERKKFFFLIDAKGKRVRMEEPLAKSRLTREINLPEQQVDGFGNMWLTNQEFPYLEVVMREGEREGAPFDAVRLRELRKTAIKDYAVAVRKCHAAARPHKIENLNSGKQLTKLLEAMGYGNLPRTSNEQIKLDAKSIALLAPTVPFIAALSKARANAKMLSAFVGTTECKDWSRPGDYENSGLEFFAAPDGFIRTSCNTTGAVTGRTSAQFPNEQQIPSRKDTYGLRKCYTAVPIRPDDNLTKMQIMIRRTRPAKRMIVLDHAQLELRVMALLCGDSNMRKVLRDRKGDLHAVTAQRLKVDRTPAKNLNFLLQYGGNEHALAAQLTFLGFPATPEQVVAWREEYNTTYPRVPAFRQELVNTHLSQDYIRLFCGRKRHLPDINPRSKWSMHKAETTLSNNVVQGSGQDFLKAAVVRVSCLTVNPDAAIARMNGLPREHRLILEDYKPRLEKYRRLFKQANVRYLMQVHDELKYLCDASAADEVAVVIAKVMSWRHYFPNLQPYSLPLVVEGGHGPNWAEAKKGKVQEGFDEWERYAN